MPDRRPSHPLDWRPDAPATDFLVQRGQLERVQPNRAHAQALLAESRRHLASARLLATTDGVSAAFVTDR